MPIFAARFKIIPFLVLFFAITGCATAPPIETVDSVNIERFMGDWYVIANIPHAIEKDAYNALESYRLAEDGTIETTFTFNKGGFDGPLKTYKPFGRLRQSTASSILTRIIPKRSSVAPKETMSGSWPENLIFRTMTTTGSWILSNRRATT
jgi:hypothetical protein